MTVLANLIRYLRVLLLASGGSAHAGDIPFHFYDFEEPHFAPGALEQQPTRLSLRQGRATIVSCSVIQAGAQHLVIDRSDPHGAVLLSGKRLAIDQRSYGEVWAKPQATDLTSGREFIDLDGAVIGLFRKPEAVVAEFHAFHQTGDQNGYWISTGLKIGINPDGNAADWHRLNIAHHWGTGTWSLAIDGIQVIEGLRRSSGINPLEFECWLFGQAEGDCAFDDLLISPLPPDDLEQQAEKQQLRRRAVPGKVFPTTPTRANSKQLTQRRATTVPAPAKSSTPDSITLDLHLKVVGGGRHVTEIELKDSTDGYKRMALYSPGYDANGVPLPLKVEIRSDTHLGEGLVLADLRWSISEMADPNSKQPRPVLVHGNFATGPTQLATVPSEWSNKALTITVSEPPEREAKAE